MTDKKMHSPFDSLRNDLREMSERDRQNGIHKTVNYYSLIEFYSVVVADKWLSLCRKEIFSDGETVFYSTLESALHNESLTA